MGKPSVETACPACGHSPIPDEADRCPACNTAFKLARGQVRHIDREVPVERAGTVIGGFDLLTSDAEAHPGTAAATLAVMGLYAGALALGASGAREANGYALLACIELALAIALQWMPSFARPLVIVSAPLQCAAWLYFGRATLLSFSTLALAIAPLLVLAAVTGATGPRRRSVVLAVVIGSCAYALCAARLQLRGAGPRLLAPAAQLELQLPNGFEPVERLDALVRYLPLRALDPRLQSYGFANVQRGAGGLWAISPAGLTTPEKLAGVTARLLDASDGDPLDARLAHGELRAFGGLHQVSYEIPFAHGRAAAVSAVQLADGRLALLLLGAPSAELESARQALAAGLVIGAHPGGVHR